VKSFLKELLIQRTNPNNNSMKYKLTKTQVVVLEKIVEGKSTNNIAQEMNVTENTVNTHIKAVYNELEVHSRAQAVRKAIEEKVVKLK
jgi:two-component system, NarL family, response regulator YdfI